MENYTTQRMSAHYIDSGYSAPPLGYGFAQAALVTSPPYLPFNMSNDARSLEELLHPVAVDGDDSLVTRIFGAQLQHQRLSLAHSTHLLEERIQLHNHILRDIEHRHLQLQEQLFGAQLHANIDDHRRELRIQQSLMQLEGERRKEEVAFWQDTMSLRDRTFETAKEYGAVSSRTAILKNIEAGGNVHG